MSNFRLQLGKLAKPEVKIGIYHRSYFKKFTKIWIVFSRSHKKCSPHSYTTKGGTEKHLERNADITLKPQNVLVASLYLLFQRSTFNSITETRPLTSTLTFSTPEWLQWPFFLVCRLDKHGRRCQISPKLFNKISFSWKKLTLCRISEVINKVWVPIQSTSLHLTAVLSWKQAAFLFFFFQCYFYWAFFTRQMKKLHKCNSIKMFFCFFFKQQKLKLNLNKQAFG